VKCGIAFLFLKAAERNRRTLSIIVSHFEKKRTFMKCKQHEIEIETKDHLVKKEFEAVN